MNKKCKTCGGRGRWQDIDYDDPTAYVWHECNDCKGTGIQPDPEAEGDYDIGGDSLDEAN